MDGVGVGPQGVSLSAGHCTELGIRGHLFTFSPRLTHPICPQPLSRVKEMIKFLVATRVSRTPSRGKWPCRRVLAVALCVEGYCCQTSGSSLLLTVPARE